jgi:hypothetical protein
MHFCAPLWLPVLAACGLVSVLATAYADPTKADEIGQVLPKATCILGKQHYLMNPLNVWYSRGAESEFEMQVFPEVAEDTDAIFTISNGQELSIELNQAPENIDAFLTRFGNGFASVETLKKTDDNIFDISSNSLGVKTLEARVSFHNGLHVSYILVVNIV